MAANVGSKLFRDFFRDSPCRMAYLLKSPDVSVQCPLPSKIVERPKTAPNPLLNRTAISPVERAPHGPPRPLTRFDRRVQPEEFRVSAPLMLKKSPSTSGSKTKHKQSPDTKPPRKEPAKKHRTTHTTPSSGSASGTKILNTTQKRDPQPRKPGCKVCLPDDPTGFLVSEIDHIRERILGRPDSISCRQAIALAQDIRNRVDAIVLPAGSGGERDTRIKFIGGRVESFGKLPDLKRKPSPDVVDRSTKRMKLILDKKATSSPLGGWMRHEEERKGFKNY
uniref:Uncharacterized protein n=1 Tax=Anopheles arabiensis TaxID=7173 RepID=A0A182HYS3_ANOAR